MGPSFSISHLCHGHDGAGFTRSGGAVEEEVGELVRVGQAGKDGDYVGVGNEVG